MNKEKLSLIKDEEGLAVCFDGMVLHGDFTELIPRIKPGKLESELIVKASGITKRNSFQKCKNIGTSSGTGTDTTRINHPLAIDATAGLGEDSLLLAAAGFRVQLYEKNEIIFALLKDAVDRALALPECDEYALLKEAVSRMETINENSIAAMKKLLISKEDSLEKPSVILLDPMFPARRKNSLVGKKLQILQALEEPCEDEEELLNAAISVAKERIIIKRPPKGPYLAGIKPTFSLLGKSVRIDCLAGLKHG